MSREQMSDTQNEFDTNRVQLSICAFRNFEKHAAKTPYNGD